MAWTTPRTWVTGELVTAAIGNVHWRDNFNAGVPVGYGVVVAGDGTAPVLVAAPLSGYGFFSDSACTAGVKWAGGMYLHVACYLPANTGSLNISLPAGYTSLRIAGAIRSTAAVSSDTACVLFNSVTAASAYDSFYVAENTAGGGYNTLPGDTKIVPWAINGNSSASGLSAIELVLDGYSGSAYKSGLSRSNFQNALGTTGMYMIDGWFQYRSTTPITSVQIGISTAGASLSASSTINVYVGRGGV